MKSLTPHSKDDHIERSAENTEGFPIDRRLDLKGGAKVLCSGVFCSAIATI